MLIQKRTKSSKRVTYNRPLCVSDSITHFAAGSDENGHRTVYGILCRSASLDVDVRMTPDEAQALYTFLEGYFGG